MTRRLWTISVTAFLAAACGRAADLYRVSGVVVDARTGAPHPRARLAVLQVKSTAVEARQITGTNGEFSFDLPQGNYTLRSGTTDDPQVYGRKTPGSMFGSSIIAGPGQDNSRLVFRWFRTSAISGRIVDDAGEPVENALVQLVRSDVRAGRRIASTIAWKRTDDRGEYRFAPLAASTYYLAVTAEPWYAPGLSEPNKPSAAYAAVSYPNSPDPAGAAPLILKPGAEARANFTLRMAPGATVRVELDSEPGFTGNVGLVMGGMGGSDAFQRQERFAGFQVLPAVPPGHYQVRLIGTSGGAPVAGRSAIDVNGSAVDVKVSLKPYPSVSGAVELKNPGTKPRGLILVSLVGEEFGGAVSTAVRPGGGFSFPSVREGKYRIAIRGTDGYFASEIHVDGAAYSKGVMDLVEGDTATVRLVASDDTGRASGFVTIGDRAVAGVLAVLAPVAETNDWLAYRGFQTDSDGSYDFTDVPSGDYLLFAVEDTGLEYTNPAVVRPYLQSAKRVHVAAHEATSERIPLAKLPSGN
jgi:hypothetical protein